MSHDPEGFSVNEDASVNDVTAQRKADQLAANADILPKDRLPADHSAGTPADIDKNTPDNVHSDGGPSVFTDEQAAPLADLEPEGITLEELRPELFKEKGPVEPEDQPLEPIDPALLDSSDEPVKLPPTA